MFERYLVENVTFEHVHSLDQPLPAALHRAKIVLQLTPADSAAQDVK
ncbi:MAG TPA: hypothetical protein VKB56_03620 [Terriglobales bacterium]|nr:hypothetical protein [Terriglobales bacterium]